VIIPGNMNLESNEGTLSQRSAQTYQIPMLRRSNRKRTATSSNLTPVKKSKKSKTPFSSSVRTTSLTTLPYLVTRKLLLYLDVQTLENLSGTCFYFDQLISGRFLTSLDFPLSLSFINEVAATSRLEKKPLLKIRCKKTDETMLVSPDSSDYMFQSQLSLLSLEKVREFDFVPAGLQLDGNGEVQAISRMARFKHEKFHLRLLHRVKSMGSLEHVTRLAILFNDCWTQQWDKTLQMFPRLLELDITLIKPAISCNWYYTGTYHWLLQRVVAASKAPVLKLSVVKGLRQRVALNIRNSFVEKLVVEGPCTMNLVPVMKKLKVVEVKLDSSPLDSCTYWKSKQGDRNLHRNGLCCVNFGNMFGDCPNLEEFMGLEVGSIPIDTFNKWNSAIKKKFYQNYLHQGGTMEFKVWTKTRWFNKRQVNFPHHRQY